MCDYNNTSWQQLKKILPKVLLEEQGHCRYILVNSLCPARDIIFYLVYF